MKWITRENANVDRIACPWLIKRFIDPDAEFLFVPRDQVLAVTGREGGHSYDAQGAEYTHRDGKCSFDVLVEEFKLTDDPGLVRLAEIVHAADVSEDIDSSPEGRGLSAIAHGFACSTAPRTTGRSNSKHRCTTRSTHGVRTRPLQRRREAGTT